MLFNAGKLSCTYSLIYEIGSGSVLLSIVESNPAVTKPKIIWSHREYVSANKTAGADRTAKKIAAAAINAGLMYTSEGLRSLTAHNSRAQITKSYATFTAPWSYTINKIASHATKDNSTFTIDVDIIKELVAAANSDTEQELQKHAHLATTLDIINHRVMAFKANGYEIKNPIDKKVQRIELSQITALAQNHIIKIIAELHEKILPKVPIELYSFMMVFFSVAHNILPAKEDYCLLDVTSEAAELGLVRNNTLSYCSHFRGGVMILTQTISDATGVPYENVTAYLKESDTDNRKMYIPAAKQSIVDTILKQYQADIYTLFTETDEFLAAPRTIYIHCDPLYETFFIEQLQNALCKSAQTTCAVKSIANIIAKKLQTEKGNAPNTTFDTALDIVAYFFHTESSKERII